MGNNIILETKFVADIRGSFYIPSYQRGYRWSETEVVRLLDDIYQNGKKNYCLQPVVVRKKEDRYELIDGQQRLTTLYLIYKYMKNVNPFFNEPAFTLSYQTRDQSEEFLKTLDMTKQDDNIDFWFIAKAYNIIKKGWYEDHDLYHRIGYLITSGTSLHKIFALSKDKKKSEFNESLDELIKKSVAISGNYAELSYEKSLDYKRISTLLLLFNIESVRRSDGHAQRFPFDQFKHHKGSNVTWSLEHIHAQQSEGMKTQDVWKKWLELHIPSVESIGGEHSELIDEMQGAINADKLERTVFESIQQKVLGLLSVSGNTEYMHSIANLALLNTADNAALNNSTFDVKRNDIIQMDKKGQYIPFCTKMVFLKYYTPSAENQLHFWGQADRIAYIKAINDVLSDYIEPIVLEKEETK